MSTEKSVENLKLSQQLNIKDDFKAPTFEEWKTKVETDLKGASYEKKLVTKTYEDIDLQPIYTKSDLEKLSLIETLPGKDNFLRSSNVEGFVENSWIVNQDINIADAEDFNKAITHALNNGQNCVNLKLDTATKYGIDADYADANLVGDSGLSISSIKSIGRALKGIDLIAVPLNVDAGTNLLPFLSLIVAHFNENDLDMSKLHGSITVDPFQQLISKGKLNYSLEKVFAQIKIGIEWAKNNAPGLRIIGVNSLPYSNAGASSSQELAYSLSTAVEYINQLQKLDLDIEDIINSMEFTFGLSTNYFMEISKLRAARVLWSTIANEYGFNVDNLKMNINTKSSTFYHTKNDPYVNMLRTTTQTFSAILGGANSITTSPFDEVIRNSSDFSRRISRNTHTVLREESHLDQVIDPAGGSFYIETLTERLAESAWKIFLQIDEQGGMLEALKNNFIQNSIKDIVAKRLKDINKRKSVLVGTNMYAEVNEKKLEETKIDQTEFQKKRAEYLQKYRLSGSAEKHQAILEKLEKLSELNPTEIIEKISEAYSCGATLGEVSSVVNSTSDEPIIVERLCVSRASEGFELLRNQSLAYKAKHGSLPKIFLANMGSMKDFKARADFSKGFFEIGGFDIVYPKGFENFDEVVNEANKSGSSIVVICSTDDKYVEIVPELAQKLKSNNFTVILAGYPKDKIEEYKIAGVDEFIFLGADAMEILTSLHNKIGGQE